MEFKDKYTNTKDKDKNENKDKAVLSDDAFAIGEVIDMLIKKIDQTRVTLR